MKTSRSLRPIAVAQEVLENVAAGKRPDITKTALKHGYSLSSALNGRVTSTKAYREHIEKENEKTVALIELERARAIAEMPKKIKKARYRDLIDAFDKFTKNHQLLTGGATENINTRGSIVMLPGVDSPDNGSVEPNKSL